jgi:hypothetical protein
MKQITVKAIEERVRRKLRQESLALHKPRSLSGIVQLGEYCIVNQYNFIEAKHIDLLSYAGELGVLASHEMVAE